MIARIRKFLMEWVLAPGMIRVMCHILSRIVPTRSTLHDFKRTHDRIFIIGNGPSLIKDLVKYREAMMKSDRLAVNFMGVTELFEELKPNVYVLVDPEFLKPMSKVRDILQAKMQTLRSRIKSATWPITVVMPYGAKGGEFVNEVSANSLVKMVYFDDRVPLPPDTKDFAGMDRNRYWPPTMNVLNAAIYAAIVWRYPEIMIVGADNSFIADLRVDQRDNRLYRDDTHYYGTSKVYFANPITLGEEFANLSLAFKFYNKLREFADWAGVRVINATDYSWIDAFERA